MCVQLSFLVSLRKRTIPIGEIIRSAINRSLIAGLKSMAAHTIAEGVAAGGSALYLIAYCAHQRRGDCLIV